jgi:signal peptidase II
VKRTLSIIIFVLSVVALDQATKYLIMKNLSTHDFREIFPFLHIVHVKNTGAAFGMFQTLGSTFFIILSAVAIFFIVYLLVQRTYNTLGLSLILGGALGNLIDRIRYGKVVDFIDFSVGSFHWPAFNVADSSLTIGILVIFATYLFKK